MTVSGQQIIDAAKKLIGDPYVFGGSGPSTFDCSGFVQYVLNHLGFHGVPRTADKQYDWTKHINESDLQPGDLVFSAWDSDVGSNGVGHVMVYAGGGEMIGAHTGGVSFQKLDAYYKKHVIGYGRPIGMDAAKGGDGGTGGGLAGSLLSLALPKSVLKMFDDLSGIFSKLMWIVNPENWARIIAGVFGTVLACFGIGFLIAAGA